MSHERLIEALRGAGGSVEAWSLYVSESRRMSLGTKDTQTGNPHAPLGVTEACAARYLIVWSDGRISRGQLERRQLMGDPRATLEYARAAAYSDPDAAQVLGPAAFPDVPIHDPRAAAMAQGDPGQLVPRLAEVRRRVRDRGFRTWSGSFSASEMTVRLLTSKGLDASGAGTHAGWFVSFDGEIGSGFGARGPEPADDYCARLDRLAELALQLREPAETMAGGELPVLLHPKVVEDYVLQTLLHHLDGSTVFHGEGHFRREQFGAEASVLREDLSLRLDPLRPMQSGSYRFTVEGVPAARCAFIEAGRLVQPVLDLKYGRRLDLPPTPLPYAMDVVDLEGPELLDWPRAMDQAGGGALVLSVLGAHTQDSTSGDFSLSAPQTLRIGDGGFVGRLRATVSGNLFDLLTSDRLRLVRFEGEHTPGLLIHCRLDPK